MQEYYSATPIIGLVQNKDHHIKNIGWFSPWYGWKLTLSNNQKTYLLILCDEEFLFWSFKQHKILYI